MEDLVENEELISSTRISLLTYKILLVVQVRQCGLDFRNGLELELIGVEG